MRQGQRHSQSPGLPGQTAGFLHKGLPAGARAELRGRFILLAGAFSLAVALLVAVSYIGFEALAGTRAYVHGESQWAKAQKRSVIALVQYAESGDPADLARAREALEVNLGDQRARLALERDPPDPQVARTGFLAGRNHPDDIPRMIRLFLWGRGLERLDQAITVWAQGDGLIGELLELAESLESAVMQHGPGSQPAQALVDELLELDERLTEVEERFSLLMGQLGQQVSSAMSLTILITALAVLLGGTWLTFRLVRSAESAERALRESQMRYRALVDQNDVGMWQLDRNGDISYLNPAMRSLLGQEHASPPSRISLEEFVPAGERKRFNDYLQAWQRGEATDGEISLLGAGSAHRRVLLHGAPILIGNGKPLGHVGTCIDITDRKRAEEQLRHQAFHDPLTGLPNRHLFMDRLQMATRRSRRDGRPLAVLFIDLDGFKAINDKHGHATGDRILKEAARRMAGVVRERDTVARIGGDEFGAIVEEVAKREDALRPACRIVEALGRDFHIDGKSFRVGASIGITLSGESLERASDLLSQADHAMYEAKHAGGGRWHFQDAPAAPG